MVKRSRGQSSEAPRRRSWLGDGAAATPPSTARPGRGRPRGPSPGGPGLSVGQQAFHHHLRRDAGMVGAGLPQHVAALHPPPADQRVLDGEGQRVAHMQAAGDVRRRDHDGEGRGGRSRVGGEGAGALPALIEAGLEAAGVRFLSSMAASVACRPARVRGSRQGRPEAGMPAPARRMAGSRRGRPRARSRPVPAARPALADIGPAIPSAAAAILPAPHPRWSGRRA